MTTRTREFDLIRWIRKQAQDFPPSLLRQVGDDCAVFESEPGRTWAVTTDALVEGVHFQREWISPYFLGRKALAVNISDLAAMGARPYACLLSLALPNQLVHRYFRSFLRGFLEAGARWKAPLIGGDLVEGPVVYIGVTAWGSLEGGVVPGRSLGRAGDAVVLVGELGFSHSGLQILQKEDPRELGKIQDEESLARWAVDPLRFRCLRAHLLPHPQIEVGIWLRENNLVNAMIDVSDGLAADLSHIAAESGLAAEIDLEQLGESGAEQGDLNRQIELEGGEDYALLFTCSHDQLEKLRAQYLRHFPPFRVIGRLVDQAAGLFLLQDGKRCPYRPRGFDHFA